MIRRSRLAAVVYPATLLLLSAGSALGANRYQEDFTTTTYRDAANTTADWNLAAAELRLFALPVAVGNYAPGDSVYSVAVAGDLAFLAEGVAGLGIVDISDPAAPALVGTYDTPGGAYGVAVAGDLAFVADGPGGLRIIDITSPASPVLIGTYATPGTAFGVAVAGDHAFVADIDTGLLIVDISDPSVPSLVGSLGTSAAIGVAVAGDLAFVADALDGLKIIDVLNTASPSLTGSYNTPGFASGVAVAGNLAFVADGASGLQIIDITSPASPALAGTFATPGAAGNLALWGDVALVAAGGAGLVMVDISNPASPALAGIFDTPGASIAVAAAGDLAFVADTEGGLRVLQTAVAVTPAVAGDYASGNPAESIVVDGDLAFVAEGSNGLEIIDVSDPAAPVHVGTYGGVSGASGVAVAGDLAFVSDENMGLLVIDVSNPASPTLAGNFSPAGTHYDVDVSGDLAFLASSGAGLRILDISNPASPVNLGSYNTPGTAYGVTVSGDHVFVADGGSGLRIVDVSNPSGPVSVGSYNTPGTSRAVAVSGDYAFVADDLEGLQIIDVTNVFSPTLAGSYDTPGNAFDVAVAGNYAFVADDISGLQVIDVSDPMNPQFVGAVSSGQTVAVAGAFAYLMEWGTGLHTVRVFQDGYDTDGNIGQSLAVDGGSDPILRVRLASTQTDTVTWELSCDAGGNWQGIVPGDPWSSVAFPGPDLLWQSTHVLGASGVNPAVSDLEIDWLYAYAVIDAVTDIANDQGKQVRVEWTRSAHDFVGDPSQITQYAVYRKIDGGLTALAEREPLDPAAVERLDPALRDNVLAMQAAGWDFLVAVPVLTEDSYAVVVPTLRDSTIAEGAYYTTFRVTALTAVPGVFFHSPPDSGYSLDNLAPSAPSGFAVAYATGSGNTLSWDASTEPDLRYYGVYRSSGSASPSGPSPASAGAVLDLSSLVPVATTTAPGWVDPDYDGGGVTYAITAVDFSGNESAPAAPGSVTGSGDLPAPLAFALHPAVPNPMRAATTIRYAVPEGAGPVVVQVYDVAGRAVRTLVRRTLPPGQYAVTWDGRDDQSRTVESGVYFYRLAAAGYVQTRKMILLR